MDIMNDVILSELVSTILKPIIHVLFSYNKKNKYYFFISIFYSRNVLINASYRPSYIYILLYIYSVYYYERGRRPSEFY